MNINTVFFVQDHINGANKCANELNKEIARERESNYDRAIVQQAGQGRRYWKMYLYLYLCTMQLKGKKSIITPRGDSIGLVRVRTSRHSEY